MKHDLLTLIEKKYGEFSKNHKILADYIEKNINLIAFLSIKELENNSGVSTATITRFSKKLGFKGYSDFQKSASDIIKNNITPMKEIKNSIMEDVEGNVLKNLLNLNSVNLVTMYTDNLNKNFKESVEVLSKTKGTIYIAASRSSYSVGYYLYFMLKGIIENVEIISNGNQEISLKMMDLKKEDCLVAISFSRYTKFTYEIATYFKKKTCKIISITDDINSPIASKSDNVLLAKNPEGAYSFVGAMTIANCIAISIGKLDRENVLKRMKLQDEIALDLDIYL